jgi:hypothetical protein
MSGRGGPEYTYGEGPPVGSQRISISLDTLAFCRILAEPDLRARLQRHDPSAAAESPPLLRTE